ncbi:MAG: helix-turn-helix domain-containing protein [Cellulomonas sp.]
MAGLTRCGADGGPGVRKGRAADADHRITCHLGPLLEARGMTLVQLSELTGVTVANLSVLKNDRARAIRFTTLTAICSALGCDPGDVLGLATPSHSSAKSVTA